MRYREARGPDDSNGDHAVAVERPAGTVCGLDTDSLLVWDHDWERGTYRTKCVDCIVLVAAARSADRIGV